MKFVIAFFLSSLSLMAQDRIFNYTYQSSVLGKNQKEIEVWATVLQGKTDFYRQIQNSLEFEIGLGSNLQTAFYLNTKQKAGFDVISTEIITEATQISFSNEWKYKFSDAVANNIGFAGYTEFTIAPGEFELELKAIFDKKTARTTQALNLTVEPEWKKNTTNGKVTTETEIKYIFNYGIAYNINKNWNLGLEISNKNVFLKQNNFTHSALFAGPTLSYNSDKFWVNFSVLPQIAGLKNPVAMSGLNLDEFTKLDARLLFSFAL